MHVFGVIHVLMPKQLNHRYAEMQYTASTHGWFNISQLEADAMFRVPTSWYIYSLSDKVT